MNRGRIASTSHPATVDIEQQLCWKSQRPASMTQATGFIVAFKVGKATLRVTTNITMHALVFVENYNRNYL